MSQMHLFKQFVLLSQVPVGSAEEALDVLRRGSRARQKARTALNQASSRSHSIFTIMVDSRQVTHHWWGLQHLLSTPTASSLRLVSRIYLLFCIGARSNPRSNPVSVSPAGVHDELTGCRVGRCGACRLWTWQAQSAQGAPATTVPASSARFFSPLARLWMRSRDMHHQTLTHDDAVRFHVSGIRSPVLTFSYT